jgi:hypothetical protein
MAQSTLRVTRRPKGSPRRALTAASQPVGDSGPQLKAANGALGSGTASWQAEAWHFARTIGELHFFVGWKAGSCSRCRLIGSEVDPETGLPTGSLPDTAEGKRVAEYVRAIADGPLGQADMQRRLVQHLSVPGETWLAVLHRGRTYADGTPKSEWFVLNKSEWRTKTGNKIEISLPDKTKHDFVRGVDSLVRIWNPDAEDASLPDSSVRGVLDPCREIERTGKKIKQAAKSRLVGNGVLFLPAEMSLPSPKSPTAEGQTPVPGAPVPIAVTGVNATETLGELLYQQGVAAIEDEDSQAAFLPLLATVPGDKLEKIQHIKFGNDVTDDEIKIRIDSVTRLAMGLDVSPERLLGFGNSNHWSAWQIGDDDVQLHISPVMSLICQAIYREIIRPLLVLEGIDADKYVLWFDPSQLTADPDLTDEATQAKDRGTLRNEVYNQKMGLPDDGGYDLTTMEGLQLFAQEAVTANPELLESPVYQMLLAGEGELSEIDWPEPKQVAIGDGKAQPGEDQDDPDEEEPDTEDDAQQSVAASVQPQSAAEFILAERLLVTRGLDLANKRRVRNNEERGRLSRYPSDEWHRYLPPAAEHDIGKLAKGWDNGLDAAAARLGIDVTMLRNAAWRSLVKELTTQVVEGEVVL